MRSRLARLGVVLTGFLSLLGTTTPAHADTTFTATFVGTATVGAPGQGLDDMCAQTVSRFIGGQGITFDLPCPPVPFTDCSLPLNGLITSLIPNCHLVVHTNTQAVAFASTTCLGIKVSTPDKGKPLPAEPVICFIAATGTVTGFCDLGGGQLTGTITFLGGFSGTAQTFTFSLHFNNILRKLLILGHYIKVGDPSNHGLLIGTGLIIEPFPPIITPQSCLNKTARNFTLAGTLAGIPELLL